jgi:hypothetical protein
LPSDFGHYDENPLTKSFMKLEAGQTGRTRTSSQTKRE